MAARTDYVAGMPRRIAEVFCKLLPVRAVELTVEMPGINMVLSWHERTQHDAGSSAFRSLIAEALSEHGERGNPKVYRS